MKDWRKILYTIIIVVVFLALTVIAAVEYSGKENRDNAKQNGIYLAVKSAIKSGDEFFSNWPTKSEIKEKNRLGDNWPERIKSYVDIGWSKEGLIIIMNNSEGEFKKNILPIFKDKDNNQVN